MTEKKTPLEMTTEEAIRKLFPAKAVREARKRATPETSEGKEPQVDGDMDPMNTKSSD